jgi:hypothetical protein
MRWKSGWAKPVESTKWQWWRAKAINKRAAGWSKYGNTSLTARSVYTANFKDGSWLPAASLTRQQDGRQLYAPWERERHNRTLKRHLEKGGRALRIEEREMGIEGDDIDRAVREIMTIGASVQATAMRTYEAVAASASEDGSDTATLPHNAMFTSPAAVWWARAPCHRYSTLVEMRPDSAAALRELGSATAAVGRLSSTAILALRTKSLFHLVGAWPSVGVRDAGLEAAMVTAFGENALSFDRQVFGTALDAMMVVAMRKAADVGRADPESVGAIVSTPLAVARVAEAAVNAGAYNATRNADRSVVIAYLVSMFAGLGGAGVPPVELPQLRATARHDDPHQVSAPFTTLYYGLGITADDVVAKLKLPSAAIMALELAVCTVAPMLQHRSDVSRGGVITPRVTPLRALRGLELCIAAVERFAQLVTNGRVLSAMSDAEVEASCHGAAGVAWDAVGFLAVIQRALPMLQIAAAAAAAADMHTKTVAPAGAIVPADQAASPGKRTDAGVVAVKPVADAGGIPRATKSRSGAIIASPAAAKTSPLTSRFANVTGDADDDELTAAVRHLAKILVFVAESCALIVLHCAPEVSEYVAARVYKGCRAALAAAAVADEPALHLMALEELLASLDDHRQSRRCQLLPVWTHD